MHIKIRDVGEWENEGIWRLHKKIWKYLYKQVIMKYIYFVETWESVMEENSREFDERREQRRKRRIRNQVISYISVFIILGIIITGAVLGITTVTRRLTEKKQAEELAKQLAQMSEQPDTVVESPAAVEQEPVEEEVDWLEELVNTAIAEMPLEDKVAGLFMITPEALTGVGKAIQAGDGTRDALNKYAVGGLVYFSQNIQDEEQVTQMLANTVGMSKYPIFLAVDEEGGSVRRVGGALEVTEIGDMADIGAGGDSSEAYNAGAAIATYLFELGFNLNFAPVADVVTDASGSAIGKRSFGGDAAVVSDMVAAAVNGTQDTGISACLKHFPGIGSAGEDTHKGMATVDKSADDMRASDFLPFQSGIEAGVHLVMVGHVSAPDLVGDDTPCSLSAKVMTDILRNELGYNGIIITDALDMAAVTENYASDEAAVMAVTAGADMILMPEEFETAYEGVLTAVKEGTITQERIDESLKRIYRVKYRNRVDSVSDAENTEEMESPENGENEEEGGNPQEEDEGAAE